MAAAPRNRSFLGWLSGDSALAKDLVRPVAANLLTALLLFLAAVLLKERIYDLFSRSSVSEYPIYCVAEPYEGPDGNLRADFFIINKRGQRYTETDLRDLIKARAGEDHGRLDPTVRLKWSAAVGRITDINVDSEFNDGKGSIEVERAERPGEPWVIRIREIDVKAILRLEIVTELQRGHVVRNAKTSLPFDVVYAGE